MKKEEYKNRIRHLEKLTEDQWKHIDVIQKEKNVHTAIMDSALAVLDVLDLGMEWSDAILECGNLKPDERKMFMLSHRIKLEDLKRMYDEYIHLTSCDIAARSDIDARNKIEVIDGVIDHILGSFVYENNSKTMFDFVCSGKGKCWHLAHYFKDILTQFEIECYVIRGIKDGEKHAWNEVVLDSEHFYFDLAEAMTDSIGCSEHLWIDCIDHLKDYTILYRGY